MARLRVFLSHKKEDSLVAAGIARTLEAGGLSVYLDVIDNNINKDGPDLADYLRNQLEACSQLLAVISPATTTSWWVPWEIGVATEKERFLASFVANNATVPDYLRKWPYLRTAADLQLYIQQSKAATRLVEERTSRGHTATARTTGFREFHRSLKASLGQ